MKINKEILIKLAQANINEYGGEYGDYKQVFDLLEKNAVDNVQWSFAENRKELGVLYIIVRGSDEGMDWKQNLRFRNLPIIKFFTKEEKKTTPYKNVNSKIRTHIGFTIDYKKIRDSLLKRVKSGNYKTIILTAHSKGSSISTLAAVDIQFHFPGLEIINIPMASPRIGNKEFVESYDKRVPRTLRIVNGEDYITKIPFVSWGYRHVGTLLKIGKLNPFCWIPVFRAFGSFYHYPKKYLENIKKLSDDFLF